MAPPKRNMTTSPHGIGAYSGFIIAFAVTKKRHLRDGKGLQELESVLSIQDVRNIQEAEHMPLCCINILTNYIQEAYAAGKISDPVHPKVNESPTTVRFMLDFNITTWQDTLGGKASRRRPFTLIEYIARDSSCKIDHFVVQLP